MYIKKCGDQINVKYTIKYKVEYLKSHVEKKCMLNWIEQIQVFTKFLCL